MKLKAFAPLVAAAALVTATVAAAAVVTAPRRVTIVLRGTDQADRISAFAGNDLVYARGGGDDVRAGAGNDGVPPPGGDPRTVSLRPPNRINAPKATMTASEKSPVRGSPPIHMAARKSDPSPTATRG